MSSASLVDPFGTVAPIPWPEFRTRILELYAPPLRARTTFISVRKSLDLLEQVGPLESTADLNMGVIARFVASRKGKENPNTTRHHLRKLSAACTIAVGEGWLRSSPFSLRRVWLRSVAPASPAIHSAAEVAGVLSLARQEVLDAHPSRRWAARRLLAVAATAAYTGMRRDEVLRARTEDLHLADGFIALVAREGDEHKTVGACAPVPLAPDLLPILRGWVSHLGGSEWLFPRKDLEGPWVGGSAPKRPCGQLKALGERCSPPVLGLTFQSLRHGWASLAESWGLTAEQIKRVLRHTNLHTQLGYRHAELTSLRAMVDGVRFGPAVPTVSEPPAAGPPQIDPAMGARPRRPSQGQPAGRAGSAAASARAAALAARLGPEVLALRAEGKTLEQIAVELNNRGHRTRRGYLWSNVAVSRILDRVSPRQ